MVELRDLKSRQLSFVSSFASFFEALKNRSTLRTEVDLESH